MKSYEVKNQIRNNITFAFALLFILFVSSCSKNVEYTTEYMEQTTGRYLYNQDNVIDVFYKEKKMFLNLGGVKTIEPVILDENTFFVADMFKKLHFVEHPETKKHYLSIVSEDDESIISYDYLKVDDNYETPSMLLKSGEYKKALQGYLEIRKQDSTSELIDEGELNSLGYKLLRKQEYENAIDVFEMNVALFPESGNVYDSLADAYLASGDSLQAYNNFKRTLEYNEHNRKANRFVEDYGKRNN